MNIFILHPNPQQAAEAHCDQHIHKMILESAQLLSNAVRTWFPSQSKGRVYERAHENHPCSIWTSESLSNMAWLCTLATSLESIRLSQAYNPHSSMDVVSTIQSFLPLDISCADHTPFAEAMFPHIKIRPDLNTVQKYQMYYRKKHIQWRLTTGRGMSYKNRPVPEFMASVLDSPNPNV